MKRNPLSKRAKKWMERNDISYEIVQKKIENLCTNIFNILNYKIDFIDADKKCLKIFKENNYREDEYYLIKFNYEEICLELYEYINKKLRLLNQYNRDDCWLLALKKSKEWSVLL